MYRLPSNGSVIPATGQMPVSRAMHSYCAQHGCDFAMMLGDNIYPDGAMADAGDAERFTDVFTTPYGSLERVSPDFRIYVALGNHDWHTSRDGAMAQVRFLETTTPFYMNGILYRVAPAAAPARSSLRDRYGSAAGRYDRASRTCSRKMRAKSRPESWSRRPWAAPQNDAERGMVHWLRPRWRTPRRAGRS